MPAARTKTTVVIEHDAHDRVVGVASLTRKENGTLSATWKAAGRKPGERETTYGEMRTAILALLDLVEISILPETENPHGS